MSEEKMKKKAFIPDLEMDLSHFVDLVTDRLYDETCDIRHPAHVPPEETDVRFLWDRAQLAAIDRCEIIIKNVLQDMLNSTEEEDERRSSKVTT